MIVIDEYLHASVATADPWKLHLMVIDNALNHSRSLVTLLEMRELEDAHLAASRAREFVTEVISAMRAEVAPGLVASVKDYFLHVQKNLHLADLTQDAAPARKAVELLEGYRETWLQLREHIPAAG